MTAIANVPESLSRAIHADLSAGRGHAGAGANRDEQAVIAVAHLLPENAA